MNLSTDIVTMTRHSTIAFMFGALVATLSVASASAGGELIVEKTIEIARLDGASRVPEAEGR